MFAYPPNPPAATTPSTITTGLDDIGGEETVALVLDDDANRTSVDDLDNPHMEEKDDETTEKVGYNRCMLDDAWSIGCERLEGDNVHKTRQLAAKRIKRKTMVTQAIARVEHKETSADDNDGMEENRDVKMAPWKKYAMTIFPELYE